MLKVTVTKRQKAMLKNTAIQTVLCGAEVFAVCSGLNLLAGQGSRVYFGMFLVGIATIFTIGYANSWWNREEGK